MNQVNNSDWQILARVRKEQQLKQIPEEWMINLPPAEQLNVIDIPRTCGLLNAREIEITETADVNEILQNLAVSKWSSLEVTIAFLKRAIVAHQLVRFLYFVCDMS